MKNHIACLCTGALLIAGCSSEGGGALQGMIGTGGTQSAVAGTGTTAAPPAVGPAGSAGTAASKPPATPSGAAGGGMPTVTQPPTTTAGTGAPAIAGMNAPATGAAGGAAGASPAGAGGAGGAAGAAPGGGPGMLASDPVIPPVMGDCPNFESGSGSFMGARLTFLAAKKSADNKGSLVFYWHGTGSSPAEGSTMFAGLSEIRMNGGIVVGFANKTGQGGDCSGTSEHSIGDFKVADQVAACGVMNFGIDPKRIYTTGCSAGGLQAGCMGINRSAYIAAVAPNSGGVTIGYGPFEDLTRVPNVMTMHGAPGADVVIVDFSQTSEGYDNYMLAKGAFVVNCNHGGGHCGAPGALQQAAWTFMKAHPFGTHPSPWASALPMGIPTYCKIFTMTSRQPIGEGQGRGTMGGAAGSGKAP